MSFCDDVKHTSFFNVEKRWEYFNMVVGMQKYMKDLKLTVFGI
jgi:hypothetical protein